MIKLYDCQLICCYNLIGIYFIAFKHPHPTLSICPNTFLGALFQTSIPFTNFLIIPHMYGDWVKTHKYSNENLNNWILHSIGRCYPLNLPLWIILSLLERDVFELICYLYRWQYKFTQDSRGHCQILIVMFVMVMNTSLVVQELLGNVPLTFPFEATPLLSHIGNSYQIIKSDKLNLISSRIDYSPTVTSLYLYN